MTLLDSQIRDFIFSSFTARKKIQGAYILAVKRISSETILSIFGNVSDEVHC